MAVKLLPNGWLGFKLFFVLFLISFDKIKSLELTELKVPAESTVGDSVLMTCNYVLKHGVLMSVKWYKNQHEFYRYTTGIRENDPPKSEFFQVDGVNLNALKSNQTSVMLKNVTLDAAGVYRCEVSTEGPLFEIVKADKTMRVTARVHPVGKPITLAMYQPRENLMKSRKAARDYDNQDQTTEVPVDYSKYLLLAHLTQLVIGWMV